ncbi:MAG: hypothetical protein FIA93_07330 [Deltaproteobacteria bacterium]|nr:hypothetical protein [Deltaproteobacteria bacterium]
MKRPWIAYSAIALMVAAGTSGCATANAIKSAQGSLERAKAAGSEAKAPYEYYSAEAYLLQANHEAGEGDNKQARAFARESEGFSAEATRKAGGGAK